MSLPDGPSSPVLIRRLRTLHWIFRPLEALEQRAQRYGETFTISKNISPLVVYFSNPQAIQQIFSTDPELFDTNSANDILLPLLGENSMILLGGAKHQRQRKLLMPPFHGDRLKTYAQVICQVTEQVISQWQIGKPFAVRAAMQEISLQVILNAVFGIHKSDRYQQLKQTLTSLLESLASPFSSIWLFFPSLQKDWGAWSPWGRFLRLKQQVNELLIAEIQSRRNENNPHRDDILSLLLAARDEVGQPMTDEELRDELITLLFAGHETTASALAWALYCIDSLPEVKEKLRAEIDSLPANSEPNALAKLNEVIARLPYLNAVCCETLRIYPIALNPFPRVTKVPMEIMGYKFEPGTLLLASTYLTHHREDIYPEPKQFKPERFLSRQFSPYEYLPFGGSDRRCIGAAFALFEMKLALATILSRCELKLATKHPIKPTRRGLTVAPPANMQMVVTALRDGNK
ncbi:cytochrome P450 [Aliterella atlantica]|uniref:Cytochrome P450 n=1 Tax=Aliterella atlantica CENA595 TaxID=1618023 RepID=A0A0D8ZZ07_9CYAN|nr:cytochrome P450 [Aliterella atlantica]KJH72446.1 cytochrome P450 [Aliterella atlantica CENA595]